MITLRNILYTPRPKEQHEKKQAAEIRLPDKKLFCSMPMQVVTNETLNFSFYYLDVDVRLRNTSLLFIDVNKL